MTIIVSVDPGETTGICWTFCDKFYWQELSGDHHAALWKLVTQIDPEVVVCEHFSKRPNNPGAELMSLEYIGVIKAWTQMNGIPLSMQTPGEAKTFWTDTKLNRLKMELPPKKPAHCRDAMRHLLMYLQKEGNDYRYLALATHPGR